ncbi:ABC transporter substrate-binding protein [Nannocystis sp.]|uniref:ABC transporter substrate-binding protein n=1 Tax=Nannocystis sp. TaxID=1962667 RepID=UPI0025F4F448|nr:ABC transporter substrate-binding protein [Nannocystis sp.]MBK7823934.1 hypothetical protein [Nannocystis sp.]
MVVPTADPPVVLGDTVVIALRRLPVSLDPTDELDPWGQRVVDDLLFEGLTRRVDGSPWGAPALAERCLVEHEGRSVACQLRPGARFHDDQPVTVADLLYSINLWIGPRGANLRQRYGLDAIKSVEEGPPAGASGDGWVRISFAHADPLVLERLAALKIVPRARHPGPRFAQQPIGSGPMRLLAQSETQMVFVRSEAIPGRAQRLELRAQIDGAASLTALRRGEIHLLPELAPTHVPRELGKPGMAARFVAFLLSPPRYDLVLYNLREGPQAGPRLRGALDQAVPHSEIAALHGEPGLAIVAPVDLDAPSPIDLVAIAEDRILEAGLGPFTPPNQAPDRETEAANRLAADLVLTELGWIDQRGQRRRGTTALRLPLSWDGSAGLATNTARALRAAWKQIGVAAPSVTAGWAYILSLLRVGKFSLALARLAGASDMDLSPWFHSRGAHNLTGIADSELDAALDAYRHANSRAERDAAKRAVAARLAALHPVSVLHAPVAVLLASRALTGLEFIDDLPRLDSLGLGAAPPVLLHASGD